MAKKRLANRGFTDFDPEEHVILRWTRVVREALDSMGNGKIRLDRPLEWDDKNQSWFIETVILGLPIPPFVFNAVSETDWQVVDGYQRLATLKRFGDGELALVGMRIRTDLEGKSWNCNAVGDCEECRGNRVTIQRDDCHAIYYGRLDWFIMSPGIRSEDKKTILDMIKPGWWEKYGEPGEGNFDEIVRDWTAIKKMTWLEK